MATVGTVKVNFTANATEFSKAAQQVQKDTEKTKSVLQTLKENFGKSSDLGQWLKIAAGSGAVFAIGKIADEFDKVTGHIVEMNKKFRDGEITGGEFANSIATSIPIIGHVISGFENIGELITHSNEKLAEQKKLLEDAAKARDKANDEAKKAADKVAGDQPGLAHSNAVEQVKNDIATLRAAGKGAEAEFDEITLKHNEDIRKFAEGVNKEYEDAIQKQRDIFNLPSESFKTKDGKAVSGNDANDAQIASQTAAENEIARLTKERDELIHKRQVEAARGVDLDLAEAAKKTDDAIDKSLDDFFDGIQKGGEEVAQKAAEVAKKHNEELAKAAAKSWEEAMKGLDKFRAESEKMAESVKTPFEKYKDELAQINSRALLPKFLGGLDAETAKRLREKAESELDKASGAGVFAAASIRRSSQFTAGGPSQAKDIADTNKNTKRAADALDAIKKNPLAVGLAVISGFGF